MSAHIDHGLPELVPYEEQNKRLRALHSAYRGAKAAADAASAYLKVVTDGIKRELTEARPGAEAVSLPAHGDRPALRLTKTESWRIDSAKLKHEDLETYVRYAKKSTSFILRAVASEDV